MVDGLIGSSLGCASGTESRSGGGLGSGPGAVLGGLALGLVEALSAGYISSAYKDVIAFGIILAVLVLMPSGLLGQRSAERV